jgi:capsular exopolysaccharide synthesis family protein
MSRLEDALRRAGRTAAMPETINVPSSRALDWFASAVEPKELAKEMEPVAVAPPPVDRQPPPPAVTTHPPDARLQTLETTIGRDTPFAERLVTHHGITPVAVEQYRRMAATLHHAQRERGIRVLMVASAVPGEGKTLTVTNLALTLSESYRRRVLVIDADLRRPMVHQVFGIANTIGLNDVLKASEDRRPALVQLSPRLHVLTAGRPDPDPMSGLTSERMQRVLREAAERFDWVILDTPPLALLPDANLLGAMVDVALMVVGAGRTPLKMIERAVEAVGRDRIVGVILNRIADENITPEYTSDRYQYRYVASGGNGHG